MSRKIKFTSDELLPATGHMLPQENYAASERVASTLGKFVDIRISNERHDRLISYLERLTAIGIATSNGRKMGGRALAPSATGKTSSAEAFRTKYEARGLHSEGERPVIIVPLDSACTSRRLFAAILRTVGDPLCDTGTEDILRSRSYVALKRLGCRLLIIDEVQHLVARSSVRNDICDVLKRFLDDGIVPLALLGTDEATELLNKNVQLASRLHAPFDMPPLKTSSLEDRKLFKAYVANLDQALVDTGILKRKSGLDAARTLTCLFKISGGVLGRVTNLIREALIHAVEREAEYVELYDLSFATSHWAVGQGFVKENPFIAHVPSEKAWEVAQ